MNLNQENINSFLDKYISFVDSLSDEYQYDANIRHLLYVIVPAFIYKYGVNNEAAILNCFKEIKIYVNGTYDKIVTATFSRSLKKNRDGYYTDKFIVINNYSSSSLPELIDNIVHEFNHAVNSINNEIFYDDKNIFVRTGLCTLIYDKNMDFIKKSDENCLEEILNTSETEEIIDIINSFGKYSIDNTELANMFYALNGELGGNNYESDAYAYQKYICTNLINNKTFTPTIKNLRFKGFISDIPKLFDDVIGVEGSYDKLNKILTEMHTLIIKYSRSSMFKKFILNKINDKASYVTKLIDEYDQKCIFR